MRIPLPGRYCKQMTRVYLVRHAHAEWVPDVHRPLSSRGRADAVAVAHILASRGLAAIYSSPERRAVETIQPLAERVSLPPTLIPDLRERELPVQPPGEFEAVVREEWSSPQRPVPGAESLPAAQSRGLAVLQSLVGAHPEAAIVVSTHGTLLALIVNALNSTHGYQFWRRLTFPDIYELVFRHARLEHFRRVWHIE